MDADQIIIEPLLTEKTNVLREGSNKKYVFKVNKNANKYQVMAAVKELFEVKAQSCRMINVKGKKKVVSSKSGHKKGMGSTPSWKKAIVTLFPEDKIEILEGV